MIKKGGIMKKFLLFSLLVGLFGGSQAQDLKPIKLNQPNVKRGLPVMTALQKRQSTREYADKKLELQDLSDLLWAAAGINRPESGKRTSPTAMNKQEIEGYVCLQEGRPAVGGGQGFVATAPVCLVMVADLSKFGGEVLMPALDAGIVSQNISLFCSGTGLVTVPRASMDQAILKSGLKLKDTQRPLINHPVGYAK